mgnify:FL=1
MPLVVAGPTSTDLARSLALELKAEVVPVESKTFPDGESYLRFERDLGGEEVVIVQSSFPAQNRSLIELFIMLDSAKDLGAERAVAVVPYLAYARQDKRFRSGEGISVKTIVKLIEASGADAFLTVDVHEPDIMKFFRIPALNSTAMPTMGRYLAALNLKKPNVIAPDEFAINLAESVAKVLNADHSFLRKHRDKVSGVPTTELREIDVKDRDAVIVDDMISTGGTVINVVKMLREEGVNEIYVACTHPLLLGDAKPRILSAGVKKILGTDSVASDVSEVSIAPVIAESLRKLL